MHILVPNNLEIHYNITVFVFDSVALHYLLSHLATKCKKHKVYGYIGHVVITHRKIKAMQQLQYILHLLAFRINKRT